MNASQLLAAQVDCSIVLSFTTCLTISLHEKINLLKIVPILHPHLMKS